MTKRRQKHRAVAPASLAPNPQQHLEEAKLRYAQRVLQHLVDCLGRYTGVLPDVAWPRFILAERQKATGFLTDPATHLVIMGHLEPLRQQAIASNESGLLLKIINYQLIWLVECPVKYYQPELLPARYYDALLIAVQHLQTLAVVAQDHMAMIDDYLNYLELTAANAEMHRRALEAIFATAVPLDEVWQANFFILLSSLYQSMAQMYRQLFLVASQLGQATLDYQAREQKYCVLLKQVCALYQTEEATRNFTADAACLIRQQARTLAESIADDTWLNSVQAKPVQLPSELFFDVQDHVEACEQAPMHEKVEQCTHISKSYLLAIEMHEALEVEVILSKILKQLQIDEGLGAADLRACQDLLNLWRPHLQAIHSQGVRGIISLRVNMIFEKLSAQVAVFVDNVKVHPPRRSKCHPPNDRPKKTPPPTTKALAMFHPSPQTELIWPKFLGLRAQSEAARQLIAEAQTKMQGLEGQHNSYRIMPKAGERSLNVNLQKAMEAAKQAFALCGAMDEQGQFVAARLVVDACLTRLRCGRVLQTMRKRLSQWKASWEQQQRAASVDRTIKFYHISDEAIIQMRYVGEMLVAMMPYIESCQYPYPSVIQRCPATQWQTTQQMVEDFVRQVQIYIAVHIALLERKQLLSAGGYLSSQPCRQVPREVQEAYRSLAQTRLSLEQYNGQREVRSASLSLRGA